MPAARPLALLLLAVIATSASAQDAPLFEDWSEPAGVKALPAGQVCFAELNGDGRPDAIVASRHVLLNREGRRLEPTAAGQALFPGENPRLPSALALADVNGDGHLDLFLGFLSDVANPDFKDDGRRNEIWLGDGKGGFQRRSDPGWSADPTTTITACFLDYDGDGKVDLFVGNWWVKPWRGEEVMVSPLYRGRGDGTFEDVTAKAGLRGHDVPGQRASRKPVFSATHTDWNDDGRQDLLVGTYAGRWNSLWRNNGDGTFTDVGEDTGFDCDRHGRVFAYGSADCPYANVFLFDIAVADYDGDGDMDCWQGTIRHWDPRITDPSMMLINQGKSAGWAFRRDITLIARPAPEFDYRQTRSNWGDVQAGWLDVDNDGWLDLIVGSSEYPDEQTLKLYHQRPDGSGRFDEWSDRLGFRWVSVSSLSLGDFDRDGATDLLVGRSHMRLSPEQVQKHPLGAGLFRNACAGKSGNGFFSLRLQGQAIGARVTLWTGEHRQVREVYGGLGIGGHRDDTECRFGLGGASKIDRLEVRWPDAAGTVQVFTDVAANRLCTLKRGGTLEEAK